MLKTTWWFRAKLIVMASTAAAGGTLLSSCGVTDLKHNAIAGGMAFVKAWTQSLFTELLPTAADLLAPIQ